jgi:hypothetical protein
LGIDVVVSGIGEGVMKGVQATIRVIENVSRNLNLAIFSPVQRGIQET